MKLILCLAALLMSSASFAKDLHVPYAFVTDFTLESIEMQGTVAVITVNHYKSAGINAKFEFIPRPGCAETFPAQCEGTVISLDDSGNTAVKTKTTFKVNFAEKFPYSNSVVVYVNGPKSIVISAEY